MVKIYNEFNTILPTYDIFYFVFSSTWWNYADYWLVCWYCLVAAEDNEHEIREATFTHWLDEAPRWQATVKRYSCITLKSPTWRWDVNSCTDKMPFICEFGTFSCKLYRRLWLTATVSKHLFL